MLTSALRNQVDQIWNTFWSGGVSNPLSVIEQLTYLLFAKRLDELHSAKLKKAELLGKAVEDHHKHLFYDDAQKKHFHETMFNGSDFDSSMLRIGAMNMTLHGIDNPLIVDRDSLSEDHADQRNAYTLILANPPFKGSLDFDGTAKDLLQVSKTKKTELLFISLFLKQLTPGGRCACIVPDGVLFGSSKAHQQLRHTLVEEQKLDAVISMPSGVFKPYAGVSTAILMFTRTDSGGTDKVWFYDMQADGFSLNDKREAKAANDIPDIITKYKQWQEGEGDFSDLKAKAFTVDKQDIADNKYDLSINRYKEIEYEEVAYESPQVILDQLDALEVDIQRDLKELRGML